MATQLKALDLGDLMSNLYSLNEGQTERLRPYFQRAMTYRVLMIDVS